MKRKVAVFKIENKNESNVWEDSDEQPSVTYVDHMSWKADPSLTGVTKDDYNSNKEILEMEDTDLYIGTAGATFKAAKLTEATAMTIVPVYVMWDHQRIPDTTIEWDDDEDYPDYDHDSWIGDNLAARPVDGGRWLHHIFITHKSKSTRLPQNPPEMTVLRIMENGDLIHLMNGESGRGQFVNPDLKKNVVSMASFTIGRESFFITASISPYPSNLGHSEYSIVEAFRVEEDEAAVTEEGKFSYLKPVKLNQKIEVFNVVKVVNIDFLTFRTLAILDTVDEEGTNSRLRLFNFDPEADSEVFTKVNEITILQTDLTSLSSFNRKGLSYILISKVGFASLYLVDEDGQMTEVNTYESHPNLVDIVPVEVGSVQEDIELVQFDKSDAKTSGQMLSYDGDGWSHDAARALDLDHTSGLTTSTDISFSAITMVSMMRVLGVQVGQTTEGHLRFGLLVFPSVPALQLHRLLQQEAEIYPALYSIAHHKAAETDMAATVNTELDKYLARSGSEVTGSWAIGTVKVGNMTAIDLPESTVITLEIKSGADADSTLEQDPVVDFRDVLDVAMEEIESKLDDIRSKIVTINTLAEDLLLVNSEAPQIVDGRVVIEGNVVVDGNLKLASSADLPTYTLSQMSTTGGSSVFLENFVNIYSVNQNNVTIGGSTTFQNKVTFSGDIQSTTLADGTTSVAADSVLKYSGGQSISSGREFGGQVSVSGNLEVDEGVALGEGSSDLEFANIPTQSQSINRDLTFSNAVFEDSGLVSPQFTHLDSQFSVKKTHLVPKSAQNIHVVGTLTFDEDSSFSSVGTSMGVVDGAVNNLNVDDMFQHCAWLSAPDSLVLLNSDSVITFTSDVEFTEVDFDEMPPASQLINSVSITEFVKQDNPSGVHNIGGDKTFASIASVEDVVANKYNSKTLDKFINKKSEQIISGSATFTDVVTAVNINGDSGAQPLVDDTNFTLLFSKDYDILPGVEQSSFHFDTIHIAPSATLQIRNQINAYNLTERVENIVREDEAAAVIDGDKIVLEQLQSDQVKVDVINTGYQELTSAYDNSYNLEDFVNIQNSQKIEAGKTIVGSVTLGDTNFLGSSSNIITNSAHEQKVAPITNCWIDVLGTVPDDVITIDKRVKFSNLITEGFSMTKKAGMCSSY